MSADLPPDDNDPTRSFGPPDEPTRPFDGGGPPADPPPEDAPPPDGGRYQVLPGESPKMGGQGRVFRAEDGELRRIVAFKDVQPKHLSDQSALRRFLFEAEVTGRLEHPGIVPVYGLGQDASGRPYYAMRYIEGETLADAIQRFHSTELSGRERAVEQRRLLTRFVSVCQAVAFAHSRGVIHRDLKPSNVMLGPFGETLVVDWGLAKRLGTNEPGGGTPEYWAPEQAAGRYVLHDQRTDVYGLGATLFHLLTGKPPHPDKVHADEPPSPKAAHAGVDGVLDGITRRAMATAQADRFPDATSLAAAIEEWLADQPIVAQRELVADLTRKRDASPDNPGLTERLARESANLGLMLAGMNRDAEAATLFQNAATGYAAVNARRPEPDPRLQAEQANCLLAAAQAVEAMGGESTATELRRQAATLLRGIIATSRDQFAAEEASLLLTRHGLEVTAPPAADKEDQPAADQTQEIASDPHPEPASDGSAGPREEVVERTDGDTIHPTTPPPRVTLRLPPETPVYGLPDIGDESAGGFTPIREIGRGGSSSVFLATDNRLGRQVAIKVFRQELSNHPRMLREVRVTAALEHPNVIRVYSAGERADGSLFLVMEYLNGIDWRQRMVMSGPGWTADHLAPIAQVCDALAYAHGRGVIHRDPKPSNVMVLPSGRAVLFDWGLAKWVGRPVGEEDADADIDLSERYLSSNPEVTLEQAIMGTPAYMSPEQARGENDQVGPASDTYTVGVGLFETISGRRPIEGTGIGELMGRIVRGETPRLRDVRPDVPPALDAIVTRAIAFRPEDRYPSAAALAADLRAFIAANTA